MSCNNKPMIETLTIKDIKLLLSTKPLRHNLNIIYNKAYSKCICISFVVLSIVLMIHITILIKERNRIELQNKELLSSLKQQRDLIDNLINQVSNKKDKKKVFEEKINEYCLELKQQELKNKEIQVNINQTDSAKAEAQHILNKLVYEESELDQTLWMLLNH